MRVPDFAVEPLAFLLSQSKKKLDQIIEGLGRIEQFLPSTKLAKQLAENSGITATQAALIIGLLTSLFSSRGNFEVDRFVGSVCSAVEQDTRRELRSRIEHLPRLRKFLVDAFAQQESLAIATKAAYLTTEHQQVWQGADIYTDLRYIFYDDPSESPVGSLVFHTLKVNCIYNGEFKEIFLALEPGDLDEILGLVERAKKKQENLRRIIMKSGSRCLNLEEPELSQEEEEA